MIRQPKIAIIGAGLVGGSAALFAAYAIPGSEIVIIDVEPTRAEGQAFDISHAAALWRAAHVRAADYDDAAGADIVVITAGAAMKPGQTRLDLAKGNVQILRQIIERVGPVTRDAIYVIATNPVDVLVRVVRDLMRSPESASSAPERRSTRRACKRCFPSGWMWFPPPSMLTFSVSTAIHR